MSRLTRAQAVERARKLVQTAAHSETPTEEARTAAVKACKYIRKYKLLDSPLDEIAGHPAIQAAKTVYDTINDPSVKAAGKVMADLWRKAGSR